MPIVNGKYKNPGWMDNQKPPISAENLNDISNTLENLDAQGGGGKRYASLVVGTSTAGWTAADCDYLCDGTADNVEIQAAMDAIPNGGEIVILSGTYQISRQISVLHSASIRGDGETSLESDSNFFSARAFGLQAAPNFKLSGLRFTGTSSSSASRILSQLFNFSVYDCAFDNTALYIELSSSASTLFGTADISGNRFEMKFNGSSASSIQIYSPGNNNKGRATIRENHFFSTAPATSYLVSGSTSHDVVFSGNSVWCENRNIIALPQAIFDGNTLTNCDISSGEKSAVTGNILYNCNIGAGDISSPTDMGGTATVSGNQLYGGHISVVSSVTVVGNSIQSPPDYGIIVGQSHPTAYAYDTALVEGNLIMCETGSSVTGIQLVNFSGSGGGTRTGGMVTGNKIINTATPILIQSQWENCWITDNFFNTGSIQDNGTNNIINGITTYGTSDLTAGSSSLATGNIYLVYE